MRPFIHTGDRTSHGGRVIGGAPTSDTAGRRIARVGDICTCPIHGPTTKIVTGDPTIIIDGQAVACEGDKTACGATLIATLSTIGVDSGGGAAAGAAGAAAGAARLASSSEYARMAQAAFGNPAEWTAQVGHAAAQAPAPPPATQLTRVDLPGLGSTYLDQNFATHVDQFISNAAANGVNLHFNSAYRTPAHQAALHNDPAAITPADTSLHSAGFAVDVNYSTLSTADQAVIRQAASDAGLSWGGSFHTPDPPHFYMDPPVDRATAVSNATQQYNQMNGGN